MKKETLLIVIFIWIIISTYALNNKKKLKGISALLESGNIRNIEFLESHNSDLPSIFSFFKRNKISVLDSLRFNFDSVYV